MSNPKSQIPNQQSIRYPGGKNAAGTYQWLIDLMPTHHHYVEPFAGSGGLLRRKPPAMQTTVVDRDSDIVAWWHRLKWPGVEVIEGDGIAWLDEHTDQLDADCLVYCDPPYLPSTRSHRRIYKHELTPLAHAGLLTIIGDLTCKVMISGYWSTMYARSLSAWWYQTREVVTRGATMRTEVVWLNYDPGDVSCLLRPYVGRTYRERERISRKIDRWKNKYLAMPAAERRAILAGLLACERDLEDVDCDPEEIEPVVDVDVDRQLLLPMT